MRLRHSRDNVRFLAGGTTLIDLMKLDVERPAEVIDINALPLAELEANAGWRAVISARWRGTPMSPIIPTSCATSPALASVACGRVGAVAKHGVDRRQFFAAHALHLFPRRRPCRATSVSPGSGCAAIEGFNRMLAILGTSEHCIATHPSDQNVALAALEATVKLAGPATQLPIADFYLLPGDTPERETVLSRANS